MSETDAEVARLRSGLEAAHEAQLQLTDALVRALDRERALRMLAELVLGSMEQDLSVPEVMANVVRDALPLLGVDAGAYVEGVFADVAGTFPADRDPVEVLAGLPEEDTAEESRLHLSPEGCCVAARLTPSVEGLSRGLVLMRTTGEPLETGQLTLAETVVVAARLVDAVTRLRNDAVERARAAQELASASALAQANIQPVVPRVPDVDLFAVSRPARAAGGDFYLCLPAGDLLWVVVGDVAGKGLPAALVMTKTVAAARLAIATAGEQALAGDPVPVIGAVADELYDYLEEVSLFVTAVVAAYEPATGRLVLTNAGHAPVLVATADGVVAVPPTSPPLGILRGVRPRPHELHLDEGDLLLLGSDGLVEQADPSGAMLGQDDLAERLRSLRGRPATEVGQVLLHHVDHWAAGTPAGDDRTLVVLTRRAEREKPAPRPAEAAEAAGTLTLAPTTAEMRRIGPWLEEVLAGLPGTEGVAVRSRLELAVHEICMNVVEHGGLAAGQAMALSATVDDRVVTVRLAEPGGPVSLGDVPVPVPGVPQEGGYGIMIVRQLVDRLDLERRGELNHWTLEVRRATGEPEGERA